MPKVPGAIEITLPSLRTSKLERPVRVSGSSSSSPYPVSRRSRFRLGRSANVDQHPWGRGQTNGSVASPLVGVSMLRAAFKAGQSLEYACGQAYFIGIPRLESQRYGLASWAYRQSHLREGATVRAPTLNSRSRYSSSALITWHESITRASRRRSWTSGVRPYRFRPGVCPQWQFPRGAPAGHPPGMGGPPRPGVCPQWQSPGRRLSGWASSGDGRTNLVVMVETRAAMQYRRQEHAQGHEDHLERHPD